MERIEEEIRKLLSEAGVEARFYRVNKTVVVDLPRRGGMLHGSSVAITCDNVCDIEGDIISSLSLKEEIVKELSRLCEVIDVHEHELPNPSAHCHIKCRLPYERMKELLEFIRWF